MPRRWLPAAVATCFFLSGVPALVDQVVWMKALGRVFGNSTHAMATVLAAFMVGLSLGSWLAGRVVDRMKRPLLLYAGLEAGIAAFAVVSMPVIDAVCGGADQALAALPDGPRTAGLFLTAFLLLMIPTALMGGTFPALASLAQTSGGGMTLPLLYGANTLGAAAGSLVSAFALIPHLGFKRTLLLSAGANLAVAVLAAFLGRHAGPREAAASAPRAGGEVLPAPVAALVLLFLAVSGGATMAYELVFARVTAMTFGGSIYSYAIVLASFLAGIGLGGILHHRFGAHEAPGLATARALPAIVALSGLLVFLTGALVAQLPRLSLALHRAFAGEFAILETAAFGTLFLMLLPPALLLGVTFPSALRALAGGAPGLGRITGMATAVNTLGASAGSTLAGFWLLPLLGLETLLYLAALANLLVAAALAIAAGSRPKALRLALVAAVLGVAVVAIGPGWPKKEMSEGVFRNYGKFESYAALQRHVERYDLVYYKDGPSATIAVFGAGPIRSLRINAKPDASNDVVDLQTQYLSSHIAAALHPAPKNALVVGLGSGATAAALALYPTIERLDVAELEPAVVEAARAHFGDVHHGVLDDPRVAVHIEDGRRFIRRAPVRYDVIVSEPSNVWVTGVADLYSIEHLRRVLDHLEEGGIYAQWVHGYHLERRWVLAALRTVCEVFPEVNLWFTTPGDFLIVASRRPMELSLDLMRARFATTPRLAEDLARCRIYGPRALTTRFLMGTAAVRKAAAGAVVLTDDVPLLEYFAPRGLHATASPAATFNAFLAVAEPCPIVASPLDPALAAREYLGVAHAAAAERLVNTAATAFEAAASLDPRPDTFGAWASLLARAGRQADALAVVVRGLAHDPEDPELGAMAAALRAAPAPAARPE